MIIFLEKETAASQTLSGSLVPFLLSESLALHLYPPLPLFTTIFVDHLFENTRQRVPKF